METHEQAVKRGKRARGSGARFELRIREDLEKKGWIVAKWTNNVEWPDSNINLPPEERIGKLVKVKNLFRGKNIPMMLGAGFPDFVCFKYHYNQKAGGFGDIKNDSPELSGKYEYCVIGVEVKSAKYLKPEEKEKCIWLLDNHIFSKILIAYKGKIRGEILYYDFKDSYKL